MRIKRPVMSPGEMEGIILRNTVDGPISVEVEE